jgi:hypothetical protein
LGLLVNYEKDCLALLEQIERIARLDATLQEAMFKILPLVKIEN